MSTRRFRQLISMSMEARAIAFALLDLTVPNRFLGIRGQLRKNTYALKLAGEIVQDRMTKEEAIAKLKWFNETGETSMEFLAGQRGVPEHVDLAKLYEAQKIMRDAPRHFCDECGVTNPKHGFYPLHHSHVVYNGELVESVSSVTCNCCHATENVPCPYCEEEK